MQTRAQRQKELMAKLEELVDELLGWQEQTRAPTLTQIEDEVLKLRHSVGQAMAQTVVDAQDETLSAGAPACPTCHQRMRSKGSKSRRVDSRTGTLDLERAHYYCPTCQAGLFPPRPATGTDERS